MNPFKKLAILLLLTALAGALTPWHGQSAPPGNKRYTLYAPLNFNGTPVECNSYLTWQKPQLPGGGTPAGLAGYNIYRDGSLVNGISSGETLYWYDYSLATGTYSYTITASYDLAAYGSPGQFGESPPSGPVSIIMNCDFPFPFYESWDMGNFSGYSWQLHPSQLNWVVATNQGNPAPTAMFNGSPGVTNYESRLESFSLYGKPYLCANMFLEFDYKLADFTTSGTEKLEAEYFIDNTWYPVFEITNVGSTGWVHQKIDISQTVGKQFKVGFRASGLNSGNIASWSVDNIRAYALCKGPAGCGYTKSGNTVHLFWQHPDCDSLQGVMGYNVYRRDLPGVTYTKLNAPLVTGYYFDDVIPIGFPYTQFKYLIEAMHFDLLTNSFLCGAFCDTLDVDLTQGIPTTVKPQTTVFPNPANDYITVQSNVPLGLCELLTASGQIVGSWTGGKKTTLTIPVSALSPGIYMIRVRNGSETFTRKIAVMH